VLILNVKQKNVQRTNKKFINLKRFNHINLTQRLSFGGTTKVKKTRVILAVVVNYSFSPNTDNIQNQTPLGYWKIYC